MSMLGKQSDKAINAILAWLWRAAIVGFISMLGLAAFLAYQLWHAIV